MTLSQDPKITNKALDTSLHDESEGNIVFTRTELRRITKNKKKLLSRKRIIYDHKRPENG